MKMSYKRYSIYIIAFTLAILLIFAGLVVLIDPFVQYHQPLVHFQTVYDRGTQSYVNPGLAKNYDYNAVVIGSSVSENFYASDFDAQFGCKALKLPYAGGTTMTYKVILDTVFAHANVQTVFYSLDYFALTMDATKPRYEMPAYLYDDHPLNDVQYILNKDVLEYIKKVISANRYGTTRSLDASYNWEHEHEFSQARVLKQYNRLKDVAATQQPSDAHYAVVEAGIANVTSVIEAHPEVGFVIFYPPYSILWYDNYLRAGGLDAVIGGMTRSMEILLQYDNVEVYSFADCEEIITNLNNYRESMHFSEKINKYMVECMAKGEYRVTKENYQQVMSHLYEFVSTYDCEQYYQ